MRVCACMRVCAGVCVYVCVCVSVCGCVSVCDLHTLVTVSSHKHGEALPMKHCFQWVVFLLHVRCKALMLLQVTSVAPQ